MVQLADWCLVENEPNELPRDMNLGSIPSFLTKQVRLADINLSASSTLLLVSAPARHLPEPHQLPLGCGGHLAQAAWR